MVSCQRCGAETGNSPTCNRCGTPAQIVSEGGENTLKTANIPFVSVLAFGAALLLFAVAFIMPGQPAEAPATTTTSPTTTTTSTTSTTTTTTSSTTTTVKVRKPFTGEKIRFDLYVMSQCPFGTQVMDTMRTILKGFDGAVDFKLYYIANDLGGGQFSSLHGPAEVDEDLRELCVMKYYSDDYLYMDYIACRDRNVKSSDWVACAKDSGMDVQAIRSCSLGAEGKGLLSASIAASNKANAQGSPTIFINNKSYTGSRRDVDFMKAICDAAKTKPELCDEIPKPVEVRIALLYDRRCRDCDIATIRSKLEDLFTASSIQAIEYGTPEGLRLYNETGVIYLPALLFDDSVKNHTKYKSIQSYLDAAGPYMNLRIGSKWDPYCEDSVSHCLEERCSADSKCAKETPRKLDVYVMSQCPYGNIALNSMKDVLSVVKDITFQVNYIGTYNGQTQTFSSLHGQGEVNEDLRQVCVMRHYPPINKSLGYVWCRNRDIKSAAWETCATSNGMDPAKIRACAEGEEGRTLLKDSMQKAASLRVGASPTWYVNDRYEFSGLDPKTIKDNYCRYNEDARGCDKALPQSSQNVTANGGCVTP